MNLEERRSTSVQEDGLIGIGKIGFGAISEVFGSVAIKHTSFSDIEVGGRERTGNEQNGSGRGGERVEKRIIGQPVQMRGGGGRAHHTTAKLEILDVA